jgi:hypothetical protein
MALHSPPTLGNRNSISATPVMFIAGQSGNEVRLDLDNFSGPPQPRLENGHEDKPLVPVPYVAEPMQRTLYSVRFCYFTA